PRAEDWAGEWERREDSHIGKAPRRPEPGPADDARVTAERRSPAGPPPDLGAAIDEARITGERRVRRDGGLRGPVPIEDAASTEPSMMRFELPARPPGARPDDAAAPPARAGAGAAASAAPDALIPPEAEWSSGLAARIDAVLQDEWANETPVVAPTKAELQALLGAPDPTRQQSLDELEALHRAVEE